MLTLHSQCVVLMLNFAGLCVLQFLCQYLSLNQNETDLYMIVENLCKNKLTISSSYNIHSIFSIWAEEVESSLPSEYPVLSVSLKALRISARLIAPLLAMVAILA